VVGTRRQEGGQLKVQIVSRWEPHGRFPKLPSRKDALLSFLPKRKKNGPTIWSSKEPSWGRCCRGPRLGQTEPPGSGTGQRAPALNRESAPKWGKPIPLFNGKDLTGWRMAGNRYDRVESRRR